MSELTNIHGEPLTEDEQQWLDDNSLVFDEPFTKTNWIDKASREQWKDLHEQINEAHTEAEWRSVLSDKTDRQAAIIHVNNFNREKWLKRVGKHDLAYRDIRYNSPYNGFAHKFHPADENDPERITYAVIAENEDVADKFREAELEMEGDKRHDIVGDFLNFPDCCREAFNENWNPNDGDVDPMWEVAKNTDAAERVDENTIRITEEEPYASVLWRYWGLAFTTHIPCSFDCEHSIEIGKKRGEIMAENGYEDAANALYNWLNTPYQWSGYSAIAHIRNQYMVASTGTGEYPNERNIIWHEQPDHGDVVPE